MNQANIKTPNRSLVQIARAAVANAKSGLQYQKDRGKVYADARVDREALARELTITRLARALRLLLDGTALAFESHDIDASAKLALTGLCDWVEAEAAMAEREEGGGG